MKHSELKSTLSVSLRPYFAPVIHRHLNISDGNQRKEKGTAQNLRNRGYYETPSATPGHQEN